LVPEKPGVCAHVPVIHGCDKFCAYCVIPYRRGRESSRSKQEVVEEVEMLVERGVLDVTLLGQNVDSYGRDLEPVIDLADLLYAVNEVPGLARLRFLTSHPNDMTSGIIRAAAELQKVCECVSLPFQTGDDEMLRRMRRGYTRSEYMRKVDAIRSAIPGVALTTDLMVGLPGETERQFRRTLEVVESVRFDKVHSSVYSERPGTLAARTMIDDVPLAEKRRRLHEVSDLQDRKGREINVSLIGTDMEVLVDGETRGKRRGRTRSDKLVYVEGSLPEVGDFVTVRITGASPYSLRGEVLAVKCHIGPTTEEVLTA
jgi:tRNA-2-methylthio-N6-dimethylallyladenosine synthase